MTKVRFGRVFQLLLVVFVAAALASTPAYAKSKKKPAPTIPTKQQAKFEKDFLKKMMDRHQRGINLATWIDASTTVTEVNAFCQNFIAREQDEMTSMSTMLYNWYQIAYTPKNKPVGGDEIEDMEDTDSPYEFAVEALSALKGYDKNEMAQMKQPAKKAFHAELKAFSEQLLSIDKAEVAVLQQYIKQFDSEEDDD